MNDMNEMLEFNQIREWLKETAATEKAKERIDMLQPILDQARAEAAIGETTEARRVLDRLGTPPAGDTDGIRRIAGEADAGRLLGAEELEEIRQFAVLCARMARHLKKCADFAPGLAGFGMGFQELDGLQEEIERCIRGGRVDDHASRSLYAVRRKQEQTEGQIKTKLESMLKGGKGIFSESFVSMRNGRYTLPVKREHKGSVPGSVIDASSTGATLFIEPSAVSRLREELERLKMEEENEEKIILYTLSAMVGDHAAAILSNLEYLEELDYIFAKGKLSVSMKGTAPKLNTQRRIRIVNGRHPLLAGENIVPLNIHFGEENRGVIITGPNTGGKTVALKTVGLLSVMAQCGLHVPCQEADLAMNAEVFCDIGDGQSIHENLSTFSSHIKNVIRILERADRESLVLMDELGSGTDPAEGMGIAVAVLEELRNRGCLFLVTTHYPEVKEYGESAEGVVNARMAFDRESLRPLYRLELGESGESCAFYIAKRLGMSDALLDRAREAAYGARTEAGSMPALCADTASRTGGRKEETAIFSAEGREKETAVSPGGGKEETALSSAEGREKETAVSPGGGKEETAVSPANGGKKEISVSYPGSRTPEKKGSAAGKNPPSRITARKPEGPGKKKQEEIRAKFSLGDSVMVYPQRTLGIVFAPANENGEVGVQIQKKKSYINYKRLQLKVPASEMYPPDYDFSIIFDTVENRKARHQMERKYTPGLEIRYEEEP